MGNQADVPMTDVPMTDVPMTDIPMTDIPMIVETLHRAVLKSEESI